MGVVYLLLCHYSKRLGRVNYWIILSIPLDISFDDLICRPEQLEMSKKSNRISLEEIDQIVNKVLTACNKICIELVD